MDEQTIFAEALERESEAERNAFLNEACPDTTLRERIEHLLRLHQDAGDFLDVPAAEQADAPFGSPFPFSEVDQSIGPYKLLEQIGEGGMGVVYMAAQQEPVKRKVAMKIIKPGMDSKQVIARFEVERQALAMMEHPNIARVLDAGATQLGRPYFVMELVRGIPITDYCQLERLDHEQRLKLFMDVCHAIHHAHQKGIVHRDIKPSNVMVTLHDGEPVVKIIDFGVAKATNQQLTDRTLFTNYAQMIGTPLYMSPEQAEMSGLDVDARSDIYSLGVLLFEMLTGTTPFEQHRLNEVGYDEMRRIICEEEPPKPSTRLSTLGAAAPSDTINDQRRGDVQKMSQALRGKLDWIAMKSLEKRRTQRYQSAKEFAADVDRYLNGEPISARPITPASRLVRWVRRHPFAAAGASVVSVACVAVAVLLAWPSGSLPEGNPTDPKSQSKRQTDSKTNPLRSSPAKPHRVAATNAECRIAGSEQTYESLAAAIAASTDGDVIEIHHDGAFETEPLVIVGKALTIAAAPARRPILRLREQDESSLSNLLATDAELTLRYLRIDDPQANLSRATSLDLPSDRAVVRSTGSSLRLVSCSMTSNCRGAVSVVGDCELVDSFFRAPLGPVVTWAGFAEERTSARRILVRNCAVVANCLLRSEVFEPNKHSDELTIERSSFATNFLLMMRAPSGISVPLRIKSQQSIISTSVLCRVYTPSSRAASLDLEAATRGFDRLIGWKDDRTVYDSRIARFLDMQIHRGPVRVWNKLPNNVDEWLLRNGQPPTAAVSAKIERREHGAPETKYDFRARFTPPLPEGFGEVGANLDAIGPSPSSE